MGASLSLAVFAALVAAITVVASMTVVAAVGLLFYNSVRGEAPEAEPEPMLSYQPPLRSELSRLTEPTRALGDAPEPLGDLIDARRLIGFFDEEESSLASFDPSRMRQFDAQFGTPEWTEEEGATEIFSAHNEEMEAAFADFDRGNTPAGVGRAAEPARKNLATPSRTG
ncbi:MAG: hypothetical protein ABMA64_12920 [Myxococcota bacterium]